MKLKDRIATLAGNCGDAMNLDWIVLTAAIIGLGIGLLGALGADPGSVAAGVVPAGAAISR